ncbi:hypothetical protein IGI04_013831 [Brassica rapa subsp. trilocularis]|uniref:Replication protein A 70 kDa DNA-binding subunit B/D first OB fold domain-containing protein n=2 Tax=Brassica TaxID=3705 RepID=A0ABQ7N9X5_BRACM|nr:hypothetical protein IGI04_013831 [Brassica rapa subsp. trilocularis]
MASFSSVTDLKPFKTMWKIRVRIIRLWKQYSAAGGLTIERVVVDCNGVKIHASVKKDLVNQFDSQLSEGSSKIFINFSVGQSCGSYRTTNHQYKISFLETTRVRDCDFPAELEEPAAIPLALKNLVGKIYLFKVGIERENFLYNHDTYKVTKIITNDEIISEFDTKVYPKLPNLTYTGDNTVLSDAPEGSLILSAESSEEVERTDLTPAKRRGTTIVNLEEAVDQNSVTRTPCTTRIKKEKTEKIIWWYIKVCTVLQDVFHKCMSSEHHVRGLS